MSHIDAKDAKVVSATCLRPTLVRIWRTLLSMRSKLGVAIEKLSAHFLFKRLNLAGYGALCKRHFFCGGAEVEMTRYGFESAQIACADGAGAKMGLGMQHIVFQFMR
jgi:hypothetical protein